MEGLSEILSGLAVMIAAAVTFIVRRQLKNGAPPAASAPEVTDTGQHQSFVALLGEQVAVHLKPITQRLDRIERNQEDQSKRLGLVETTVARIDERTRTP